MLAIVRNSLLLVLGFLLAVLFVYAGGAPALLSVFTVHSTSHAQNGPLAGTDPLPAYELLKKRIAAQDFPAHQRVLILQNALDEATLDSLEIVRDSFVTALPSYESTLESALRTQGLESLLSRFRESDWEDWPRAAHNVKGGASSARLFVDDVSKVNPELGSYLETSAYLFHGLYSVTDKGEVFDAKTFFLTLLDTSEESLVLNRPTALMNREFLDPTVMEDTVFRQVLERERSRLVAREIAHWARKPSTVFTLLSSVTPQLSVSEMGEALSKLLLTIATQASPGLRSEFLLKETESRVFRDFSKQSPVVRRALARLFLVGAIDSLEQGDRQMAGRYLRYSVEVKPGLGTQTKIAELLLGRSTDDSVVASQSLSAGLLESQVADSGLPEEQSAPAMEESDASTPRLDSSAASNPRIVEEAPAKVESSSGFGWMGYITLTLVLIAGIFGLNYFIHSRAMTKEFVEHVPETLSTEEVESLLTDIAVEKTSSRAEQPEDLDFGISRDPESELGLDFGSGNSH